MMSEFPHELIRQVQICTREAVGLPDYNPSDPTLPALPSLSATVATLDPSPPHLRCNNCNGRLLRGSDSIICVYCGRGPQNDVVHEPICFTSTIGYQWLLRSLHLDGSEVVELPKDKSGRDKGQRSPSAPTRLSDFLNLKIQWPVEMEKQVAGFSGRDSEESKRYLTLTGIAPDKFFVTSKTDMSSDMSIEQTFVHNQIGPGGTKDATPLENRKFQNVQSSEPDDSSSKLKNNEAFSGWEADFQSAHPEDQQGGSMSSNQVSDSIADSGNKFQDARSFDISAGSEIDLATHIDSVFGPGKDLDDEKQEGNRVISPGFNDWNSDDIWSNLSSNKLHSAQGFDAATSTKDDREDDEYPKDLSSTSADLFQDFQWQTSNTDMSENKTKHEAHKTVDDDSFEEWNDYTGSSSLQGPSQNTWTGSDKVSTSDRKFSDIDLFSLDSKFGETDSGSFQGPTLYSTSTSNTNVLTEVNAIMSENPASDRLNDASSTWYESMQATCNGDAFGKSTNDDVMMLISQTHDLSFMLENELCIPSGSDAHSSYHED